MGSLLRGNLYSQACNFSKLPLNQPHTHAHTHGHAPERGRGGARGRREQDAGVSRCVRFDGRLQQLRYNCTGREQLIIPLWSLHPWALHDTQGELMSSSSQMENKRREESRLWGRCAQLFLLNQLNFQFLPQSFVLMWWWRSCATSQKFRHTAQFFSSLQLFTLSYIQCLQCLLAKTCERAEFDIKYL